MRRRLWILGGLLGASVAALSVVACEENTYVYTAQRYDPVGDCLDPYKSIELVSGSEVKSTCPATCLMVDKETYITSLCGPLPANADLVEPDAAACVAARALANADAGVCGADEEEVEESEGGEPTDPDSGSNDVDAAIENDGAVPETDI